MKSLPAADINNRNEKRTKVNKRDRKYKKILTYMICVVKYNFDQKFDWSAFC